MSLLTSSNGQLSSTTLPVDEQYHRDMYSCPLSLDEQVNDGFFKQLSRLVATSFIFIQVVSSSTPLDEQFNSTTVAVGAKYGKNMFSHPPPLDK